MLHKNGASNVQKHPTCRTNDYTACSPPTSKLFFRLVPVGSFSYGFYATTHAPYLTPHISTPPHHHQQSTERCVVQCGRFCLCVNIRYFNEYNHFQMVLYINISIGSGCIIPWACFPAVGTGRLVRIEGKTNAPMYGDVLDEHLLKSVQILGVLNLMIQCKISQFNTGMVQMFTIRVLHSLVSHEVWCFDANDWRNGASFFLVVVIVHCLFKTFFTSPHFHWP